MSTKTDNTYHHGNLREELLHKAISIIREKGVEKLSLRALARDVGVSQTAPYRHFTDKNELLAELATLALEELANEFLASITLGKSAPENIQNAGEVYLRYAFDNPEKYRLMFGRSEEHTSELQSRPHLVCRLLLEKKKQNTLQSGSTFQIFTLLPALSQDNPISTQTRFDGHSPQYFKEFEDTKANTAFLRRDGVRN